MVVSVVVLVYNAQKTIERCLKALLSQTYTHFELVIVDDSSADSSLEKIRSFKDKRIKIIKNDSNKGIAKSRNVGWKAARGEYIFFTDSDCMALPQWLEVGVEAIKGYDLVTGWTLYENSWPSYKDRVVQGKDVFFTCNLGVSREALEKVEGFDEELAMYGEDKDVCFRILEQGGKKVYCEQMMVIHQTNYRSIKDELKRYGDYYCGKLVNQVKHGSEHDLLWRIIRPDEFVVLFFPFLLLITRRFAGWNDVRLLPFSWIGMWRGRFRLWGKAVRLRKFYL